MTGIAVTGALVALVRLVVGPIRLPWRRRPFRLAPGWYRVETAARHRADPDPGRDWVVW